MQQNSRQYRQTINVKNFSLRCWSNKIYLHSTGETYYSKHVNAIYQKHIFWKISRICINYVSQLKYHFILFRFYLFRLQKAKNFLLQIRFENFFNQYFPFVLKRKISFNSNEMLRIESDVCVMHKDVKISLRRFNRFSFTELSYWNIRDRDKNLHVSELRTSCYKCEVIESTLVDFWVHCCRCFRLKWLMMVDPSWTLSFLTI